jgi:hypothetical protein
MSLSFHESGHLKGQVTADNGADASQAEAAALTGQQHLLRRMDDPRFREAVRMAANADPALNGGETALEQCYRHQLSGDLTTRGVIAGHNAASRILRVRPAIIRQ